MVEKIELDLRYGFVPAGHFVVLWESGYDSRTGELTGDMAVEIRTFPCEGSTAAVWQNGQYLMGCAKRIVQDDWVSRYRVVTDVTQ